MTQAVPGPVTNPTNLTNNAARDVFCAWSPDGTQIAFWSDRDGNGEVYVMNADGSNPTNLTNDPGSDWWPVWSPDGTQIAFVSGRDGNREICVMNLDGSGMLQLTHTAFPGVNIEPSWSPSRHQ